MQKFVLKLTDLTEITNDSYIIIVNIIENHKCIDKQLSWTTNINQATQFTNIFELVKIKENFLIGDKAQSITPRWNYEIIQVED